MAKINLLNVAVLLSLCCVLLVNQVDAKDKTKTIYEILPSEYPSPTFGIQGDQTLPITFLTSVSAKQCKDGCSAMTNCGLLVYSLNESLCLFYGSSYLNGQLINDANIDTYVKLY